MSSQKVLFLKGIAILVMLLQHWNILVFRLNPSAITDSTVWLINWFTVPFGSQLFLLLSCISLGTRSPESLRVSLPIRWKIYLGILLVSLIEASFFGFSLDHILSLSPIGIWVICWVLVSIIYAYLGVRGVIVTFFLSFALGPLWDIQLKYWIQETVWSRSPLTQWTLSFPIISFLGYAAQGVLLGKFGKLLFCNHSKMFLLNFSGAALLPYVLWLAFSDYQFSMSDITLVRQQSLETWLGRIATHSIPISTIALLSLFPDWNLERLRWPMRKALELLRYAGHYSLYIFFLKRFAFIGLFVVVKLLTELSLINAPENEILSSIVATLFVLLLCHYLMKLLFYLIGKLLLLWRKISSATDSV